MADAQAPIVDNAFIHAALREANLNALRIALYHQTGDVALAQMRVVEFPVRGGAFTAYAVAREHHDELRQKAFAYLTSGAKPKLPPTKTEAAAQMALFTGKSLTQAEIDYGWEDLAFDPLARTSRWSIKPASAVLDAFDVTIVGAGISGIMAAIQLDRLGIRYRIIERMSDLGGTWHLNDYPDARVDISTFLYQYKFEARYPWKSYFATQAELKDYLNHIVDKYGVRPRIQLETRLEAAVWDENSQRWQLRLTLPDGTEHSLATNAIISASGLFSTPNLPDIPGIDSFAGTMFHTTQWDHGYDYRGKRVALIGTGSTGSQLMPGIAPDVAQMTVFQRTPNWVTPAEGYQAHVAPEKQWLIDAMPGYWNWFIYASYIGEKQIEPLQEIDRAWCAQGGRVNERNERLATALKDFIRSKVGDNDALYEKLIPPYPPVARRLVIDNGWYDALVRDNVELVTEGIARITPKGIETVDGAEREFDLIVLGAGFKVSQYLWPVEYRGRDGATLEQLWAKDGARAYLSITMPGFPNFFMFYGPNGQARAGGFHSWAEIYSRYIGDLLAAMIERGGDAVEVRRDRCEDYNARMDAAVKHLLWEEEGKGGYYVNAHGRSGVNMPWTMHEFYELITQSTIDDYVMTKTAD